MNNGRTSHEQDVEAFNRRFDMLVPGTPGHLTQRKLMERIQCLAEELYEFADACGISESDGVVDTIYDQSPLAAQADALVDLVYFAIGTAVMLGLPWQQLWDDVHRANMLKVPGAKPSRPGHRRDLIKPPGWEGPQTDAILAASGYRREDWTRTTDAIHGVDDGHLVDVIDEGKCRDDV